MILYNEVVTSLSSNHSKRKTKRLLCLSHRTTTAVVTTTLKTPCVGLLPYVQDRNHLLNFNTLRQNYQLTFTTSDTQIKIKLESKSKLKQNQALTFEGCWILISWESDAESDLVPPEFGFSFFLFCFFFFFFAPKSPPWLLPEIQRM